MSNPNPDLQLARATAAMWELTMRAFEGPHPNVTTAMVKLDLAVNPPDSGGEEEQGEWDKANAQDLYDGGRL